MPFVPGYACGAAALPAGRSIWILNITGHSWKELVDKLDVTSSLHGGIQALIAGIGRGDGSVKGYIDNLNYIWNAPIRAGINATFALGVGGVGTVTIPALITAMHLQSAIEGKAEYDCDISLNLLASATYSSTYFGSGSYLLPAA